MRTASAAIAPTTWRRRLPPTRRRSRSARARPCRATICGLRGFWAAPSSKHGEWAKAGLAYASARDAFLLLFGQGLNDAEARDLIAEAGPLFAEAAFAAAQRGRARRH